MQRKVTSFFSQKLSVEKMVCGIFFLGFLFLGIHLVDDYGMSWDEEFQRENGRVTYNFAFHGIKSEYLDSVEKYHGPAIEWPLYTIERILQLSDDRDINLFRHLVIFLIFLVSSIFFYKLIRGLYGSWPLAMIGTLIYIASPRIFADAFYNTKDIGALSVFTICMYAGLFFYRSPTKRNSIIYGFLCGYLVAIRLPAIILPVTSIGIIGFRQLLGYNQSSFKKLTHSVVIFTLAAVFSMTLFWPIMWLGPKHFYLAWNEMSHYAWLGKNLFMGNFVEATNLSWNYIPVWVGITTPVITLVLLLAAFIYLVADTARIKKINMDLYINNLAFFVYLLAPVLAVIVCKSVLYDGWRHLYFINAPMTALACYPLFRLYHSGIPMMKKVVLPAVIVCLLPVVILMVKIHPYENIYFNRLVFHNAGEARFKYEMDYWGLSYRKGLEYILATDQRPKIKVFADTYPGHLNAKILKKNDRDRLEFVKDSAHSDYFLSGFRWKVAEFDYAHEVYSITVDGAKILTCIQMK